MFHVLSVLFLQAIIEQYIYCSLIASKLLPGALSNQSLPDAGPSPFSHHGSKLTGFARNRQAGPETQPDRAFSNFTKLFVVGGFNDRSLGRVEILDLKNASATFNITSHPVETYGMTLGAIEDVVKTCGGANNGKNCHDYHPDNNTWVASVPMMHERYHHGASFIENLWLLSGSSGFTDAFETTEKWTGSVFEEGISLQRGLHGHCQLTLNDTHIFFVMADGKANYLLDWPKQEWTELDPMMYYISNPSCGIIHNTRNGKEAVVAGFGKSQIFNFDSMIWRIGPDPPYFYGAGYTQLADTFVVVGGKNLSLHILDTIYKFDNVNYGWIILEHKLQVPACSPGVATIPDSYVALETGPPDMAFNDYTKLVVIGGYTFNCEFPIPIKEEDRTKVFDLQDPSKTCNKIREFPVKQKSGMVVGFMQGIIKVCGGEPGPKDACFDYHPDSNTWIQSTTMLSERYYFAASFIDDLWLLSGSDINARSENTSEYWNGTAFIEGPNMERPMGYHCQLTLNATHVFFAEPNPNSGFRPNYLLNWLDKTWTELPPAPIILHYPSCGLINNPIFGCEAVLVTLNNTQIFNFNNSTWREGPEFSYVRQAGYTQLSDTFVLVGGAGQDPLDRIYKFNNLNYTWEELDHRLERPICWYPGAVTVPDSFVSCN